MAPVMQSLSFSTSGSLRSADLSLHSDSESLSLEQQPVVVLSPFHKEQHRSSIYRKPSILTRQCSSEFTFDKLRFSSLGLYGRSTEKKMLVECLEKIMAPGTTQRRTKKQTIFLSGESGTGKTVLAETTFCEQLDKSGAYRNGAFVSGKCAFRDTEQASPFAVIAQACRQLCEKVLEEEEEENRERIKSDLVQTLGTELSLMANIVPRLRDVVGTRTPDEEQSEYGGASVSEEAKNRCNYAFRRFFRVMTTYISPLILFIDDLQWSDLSSLDLLESLISDPETPSLMVIGSFRSNEVDQAHRLTSLISVLKEREDVEVCEIHTANLSFDDAHCLILDLLSLDDDTRTRRFTEICYQKTNGNPFFLVQFLSMLHSKKVLVFSLSSFKWTWTEEEIERCMATDNVVDLVKSKMERLPTPKIQMLEVAACLGYEIDVSILRLVWLEMKRDATVDVDQTMEDLVNEGIFERVGDDKRKRYRWIHDALQEGAVSLTCSDDVDALKAKIGYILVTRLCGTELDGCLFVAVDLLNKGSLPNDKHRRVELAEYNLQAAKKSVEFAAFKSALTYAEAGIAALPQDHFEQFPDLSFRLYTLAAQTAGYQGEIDRMEHFCAEVIRQPNFDLTSKFDVYSAMIDSTANRGRRREAIEIGLEILSQCGCSFPKNPLAIKLRTISGVVWAKRKAKAALSSMPNAKDARKIQCMRMLDKLSGHLYIEKHPLFVLAILRKMDWILQDGYYKNAPASFASIGIIFSGVLFDLQTGAAYAESALQWCHEVRGSDSEAKGLYPALCILAFTRPLFSVLGRFLATYEIAIRAGDVEIATWCLVTSMSMAYQSGKPLEQLEADCCAYVRQMRELKREFQASRMSILWQGLLNLLGRSEDPLSLSFDGMDEEETYRSVSGPGHQPNSAYFYCWKGMLYTLFGEYEKAAKIAIAEADNGLRSYPSSPYLMMDYFYKGVALFAMTRVTRKRVYLRHAKRCLAVIKKWTERGNPNVAHFERLLQAELLAYQGKIYLAKNAFEAGTVLAARGGFIHDSAFASERFGEFLLEAMGDEENAVYKFKAALSLYEEWGAVAKVEHLRSKYESWLSVPTTIVSLSSFDYTSEAAPLGTDELK